MENECRFVAFSPVRFGREIGRIGFHHERSCRTFDCGFTDLRGGFKGGDTTEGNKPAKRQHTLGIFPRADETMKYRADGMMIITIDRERIFKRSVPRLIASVDHHVESGFHSELEMLAEQIPLTSSKGVLIPLIRSRVIVIKPGLADRTNSGVRGKGRKLGNRVIRCMMRISRMNADAGVDDWILGESEVRRHIPEARRESDQAANTCGARAID